MPQSHRTCRRLLGVLLFLAISFLTLQAQQGAPATVPPFSTVDVADSQQFLSAATRHTKPSRATPAVERLLKEMTLKEKIGQMTQLEIGMVTDGADAAIHINPAKLHKAIS